MWEGAAIVLIAFAAFAAQRSSWRSRLLGIAGWAAGFSIPFAACALFFHARGALAL